MALPVDFAGQLSDDLIEILNDISDKVDDIFEKVNES